MEYHTGLLEIGDLIEGSASKGDAKFSKPSPETFEAAFEQAGTDAELTLVAGDTPYDILAAHCGALRWLRCCAADSSGKEDRQHR